MGITPLQLTGQSQYASDFQNILTRAVSIAEIPIRALQNRDADLLQQKTLLGGLNSAVSSLASRLKTLGEVAANRASGATSSNTSAVSVSNTGASTPARYTIDSITSIATAASERTNVGYADSTSTPVSSTGSLKLKVGTQEFDFSLTNNTLLGLRDKINSLGSGVTASILTTSGANYLSLSANSTGETTLELLDDPTGASPNLLTATNQGTDADFLLNGIHITQKGNVVNSVIPGLTFTLLDDSATPVNLTLASDRSQLSAALSGFAADYNTLRAQLDAQTGTTAGLLTGHPVVAQLNNQLRQLTSYRDTSGTIHSLEDLGISFSNTGRASFDAAKFNALSDTDVTAGFSFIGSTNTGIGGFRKAFEQFSDPIGGIIKIEQDGIDRTDKNIQNRIVALAERITSMQTALSQRLALADSLSFQLESQQNTIKASLQGLSLVLYGKQNG